MSQQNVNIKSGAIAKENLSLEVTTHCNSNCSHCFVRAVNAKCSELPEAMAKDIVLEGFRLGYRCLHLTGGEPFLWNGIFKTLDYASSLGFEKILINTNGSLLTDEIVNRLSDYNGLSISVSLDGQEPQHDRIRGKGSHRQAICSIEKVLDANIDLHIFTTVSKSLLPVLPSFADEIYNKLSSIKSITLIQLIRASKDDFRLSHELLDPDDFLKLVRMVSILNLCGYRTDILNNPLSTVVSHLHKMPGVPGSTPLVRNGHLIIMANRNITLSHSARTSFGKYKFGMIREVLNSDGYRLANAPDDATCPACRHAKVCNKNGMIRPSEWFRDMYAEVPYCKRVLGNAAI
jgi:MoaA/NifB/PqqE/SkfB family radical SAM enzyme